MSQIFKLCIHGSRLTVFTEAGFHFTKHQCGQSVQWWFGLSWKSLNLEFQCWSGLKNVFCMVVSKWKNSKFMLSCMLWYILTCVVKCLFLCFRWNLCAWLWSFSLVCVLTYPPPSVVPPNLPSCVSPASSCPCFPFPYLNPPWCVWVFHNKASSVSLMDSSLCLNYNRLDYHDVDYWPDSLCHLPGFTAHLIDKTFTLSDPSVL